MTLNIIGLGLSTPKDITLKGLEIVKKCDILYLETYTAILNCTIKDLEDFYGKNIIIADRELVEKTAENTILKDAQEKNVGYLVIGDPFSATTHFDLIQRAQEREIKIEIIDNVSIFNAVSRTGLQLYKFGKTTSIPYPEDNFKPTTAYDVISMNKKNGLHTLVLLDIKAKVENKNILPAKQGKYMTINEGLNLLLEMEKQKQEKILNPETFVLGCARLTAEDEKIIYGKIKDLLNYNFGLPLHSIIVPGELHFVEEEILENFKFN